MCTSICLLYISMCVERIHSLFLYCIANNQGLCKFGFSREPSRRLRALQTGSADQLHLVESVVVPEDRVREYERILHKEFAHLRVRGEWFNCDAARGASYLQWFAIHYL